LLKITFIEFWETSEKDNHELCLWKWKTSQAIKHVCSQYDVNTFRLLTAIHCAIIHMNVSTANKEMLSIDDS